MPGVDFEAKNAAGAIASENGVILEQAVGMRDGDQALVRDVKTVRSRRAAGRRDRARALTHTRCAPPRTSTPPPHTGS